MSSTEQSPGTFLLARITEDETVARSVDGGMALPIDLADYSDGNFAFVEQITPARVLAECEAKRRIVERYLDVKAWVDARHYDDEYAAELSGLETAVEFLAGVYVDHPDYREEWRP